MGVSAVSPTGWHTNLIQQFGDPAWHIADPEKPLEAGKTAVGVWATVCGLQFEPVIVWQSGEEGALRDPMCPACLG